MGIGNEARVRHQALGFKKLFGIRTTEVLRSPLGIDTVAVALERKGSDSRAQTLTVSSLVTPETCVPSMSVIA